MQAINKHNEISFKKQQEHIESLTRQYRLVCEKLGISPSLIFNKAEELNKILKKNTKSSKNSEDIDNVFEQVLSSRANYLILIGIHN